MKVNVRGKMISWFEKNVLLSWIITLALAVLIFYVSSLTAKETSGSGTGINAIVYHLIVFFLLGFFLFISVVRGRNKGLMIPATLLLMSYGILDELHQYFVPGRTSTFSDVVLDSVGIMFAFIFYFISMEYRR